MSWDTDYIAVEFNKVRPEGSEGVERIHVKVRSDAGQSRWVGLPMSVLDGLIEAAQEGME
jgi:hypothetical protein